MISREDIIKTVRAVIKELFPFLITQEERGALVLLPKQPVAIGIPLDHVKRRFAGKSVRYAGYAADYGDGFKPDDDIVTDGKSLCAKADIFTELVMVAPPLSVLRKIAAADESDTESALALYGVMHGRPVEIVTDFALSELPASSFGKSVSDLYTAVSDMGVKVTRATTKEQEDYDPMAGFVNDETVCGLYEKGKREVVVTEKTVVTPLARDRAEELGMRIRVK